VKSMTVADICLDENQIQDLLTRRTHDTVHVQAHLDRCPGCRELIATLVRLESPIAFQPDVPFAKVDRSGEASSFDFARPSDDLIAGDTIGDRFILDACLGAGGMGVVWSAHDANDQRYALKFLRTDSEEQVRRLRREAAVLCALRHPNIVAAHEVLETSRGPVLVMELLCGTMLDARLAGGRTLSAKQVAPIALQILSALGVAHGRGIVHRDLKPQNIFVGEDGRVRVFDFGMAKLTSEWMESSRAGTSTLITRSGTIVGTPLYMAPEQIFGERDIDARADLWSFGVVMYRALTGRLPIEARTIALVMKALTQNDLRAFEPVEALPIELHKMIERLLSIRRDDRPASIEEPYAVFTALGGDR
jgi:serine/threonine protein kinase